MQHHSGVLRSRIQQRHWCGGGGGTNSTCDSHLPPRRMWFLCHWNPAVLRFLFICLLFILETPGLVCLLEEFNYLPFKDHFSLPSTESHPCRISALYFMFFPLLPVSNLDPKFFHMACKMFVHCRLQALKFTNYCLLESEANQTWFPGIPDEHNATDLQ